MIRYALGLILCSGILLTAYRLLLEKEKIHVFNRAFLLLSILCSFCAPLLHLRYAQTPDTALASSLLFIGSVGAPAVTAHQPAPAGPAATVSVSVPTPGHPMTTGAIMQLILAAYIIITITLAARRSIAIYRLYAYARKRQVIHYAKARLVISEDMIPAHTWLSYIFISRKDYGDGPHGNAIVQHELAHVRQKHSLDILLLELARTIAWFNPCWHFFKKALQLNHEFLADNAVIIQGSDIRTYQYLLLSQAAKTDTSPSLASSLIFSITKKRMLMMTKTTTPAAALCRKLTALLLSAACTLAFAQWSQAQIPAGSPAPGIPAKTIASGDGASEALLREYDSTMRGMTRYQTLPNGRRHVFYDMSKCNMDRMTAIYLKMNKDQRGTRTEGAACWTAVITPPARRQPAQTQLQKWNDAAQYGVWIDSKKVSNQVLQHYRPEDFALYYESRLSLNTVNYGKYHVQVDLYTPAYYERTMVHHPAL